MSLTYRRRISPLDIAKLLEDRGVKPSQVTVEEDVDEVRITITGYTLSKEDEDAVDELMKASHRRR